MNYGTINLNIPFNRLSFISHFNEYLKKKNQGKPWWLWTMADRKPTDQHLAREMQAGQNEILTWMVLEFFFERQHNSLRQYCEARSIELLGDVAMYVAADSVDVWSQQDLWY